MERIGSGFAFSKVKHADNLRDRNVCRDKRLFVTRLVSYEINMHKRILNLDMTAKQRNAAIGFTAHVKLRGHITDGL